MLRNIGHIGARLATASAGCWTTAASHRVPPSLDGSQKGIMPKKRTLSSSDEDVYHVEVITRARVNDNAEWEYLVSWAGYSSGDDR